MPGNTPLHDGSKSKQLDISPIKGLPITILVNNAGAATISEFTCLSDAEIRESISLNAYFPTDLTCKLLPLMSAKPLILNVSSYAGLIPPPFLAVYAGTKAYINAFSIGLQRELTNAVIISLLTGSVNTGSNRKKISFFRPSARTYAKSVLNIIGRGRKTIMPYWPHALQISIMALIPEKILDKITRAAIKKELDINRR